MLEEKEHYMELLVEELELKCDEVVMVAVKDSQWRKLQALVGILLMLFLFVFISNILKYIL